MWALKNKHTGEFMIGDLTGIVIIWKSKTQVRSFLQSNCNNYILKDWIPVRVKVVEDD